jgi:hypothetical protein
LNRQNISTRSTESHYPEMIAEAESFDLGLSALTTIAELRETQPM